MTIITLDKDHQNCLTRKSQPLNVSSQKPTFEIIRKLEDTLLPLMPAAGLAAPQIGILKQAFIFSWNRTVENIVTVVNPSFKPLDEQMEFGWEGCLSIPGKLAYVPRYQNIQASYINRHKEHVTYNLLGFSARVFQHEYDHLQGICILHKPGVEIREFPDTLELIQFISDVRKGDQAHYIKPVKLP